MLNSKITCARDYSAKFDGFLRVFDSIFLNHSIDRRAVSLQGLLRLFNGHSAGKTSLWRRTIRRTAEQTIGLIRYAAFCRRLGSAVYRELLMALTGRLGPAAVRPKSVADDKSPRVRQRCPETQADSLKYCRPLKLLVIPFNCTCSSREIETRRGRIIGRDRVRARSEACLFLCTYSSSRSDAVLAMQESRMV